MCSKSACVYATSCPCVRVCATMRDRTAFSKWTYRKTRSSPHPVFLNTTITRMAVTAACHMLPRPSRHPLAMGRIPGPCLTLFHLYGICKPFLIAGPPSPAHEKGRGRIPEKRHLFKRIYDPASCLRPCNAGSCSSGLHPTSGRQGAEGRIPVPVS